MGKTILPPAGVLADEVRELTLESVARMYDVTIEGAARRLNLGGYTRTGYPKQGAVRKAPVGSASFEKAPPPLDESWMVQAACTRADPAWFYGRGAEAEVARQVCAGCPVRLACLTWALAWDEATGGDSWGIHGGLDGAERDALRKKNKRIAS